MSGTLSPPDGFEVRSGTWGIDMDREETVVEAGSYAVKMLDTGTTSSFREIKATPYRGSAVSGLPPQVHHRMRVRGTTTDDVNLILEFLDSSLAVVLTTSFTVNVQTVDTWETHGSLITGPADARYYRPAVERPGTSAGTFYIGALEAVLPQPYAMMAVNAGFTVPTWGGYGAGPDTDWDIVGWGAGSSVASQLGIAASASPDGELLIVEPGLYSFEPSIRVNAITPGTVDAMIEYNTAGSFASGPEAAFGYSSFTVDGGFDTLSFVATKWLDYGTVVRLVVRQDTGNNLAIVGTDDGVEGGPLYLTNTMGTSMLVSLIGG